MRKFGVVSVVGLALIGCTDGEYAKLRALGNAHGVTCYSGGKVIYSGRSTGAINNEEHSDGFYFEDAASHQVVRVNGDCVITVDPGPR